MNVYTCRSSRPDVFLGNGVLKIYSKFTGVPKCDFNKSCFATLLKPHFGMSVLLYICCIFSERLFLKTPLGGCFCTCKDIL